MRTRKETLRNRGSRSQYSLGVRPIYESALLNYSSALQAPTPIVTKGKLDPRWEVHPLFTEVVRKCKKCEAEAVQIRTDGKAVKAICLHCFNIQEV